MARFLVYAPANDVRKLDEIALREGKSREAVLREAASNCLQATGEEGFEKYFDLWARPGIIIDTQDYDRKRRAEWTRPWDDDYEAVRAESPDMFDGYDNRQRQIYLHMSAGKYAEFIPNEARAK